MKSQSKGGGAAHYVSFSDANKRAAAAGAKTRSSGLSGESGENKKLIKKLMELANMLSAEDRNELLECIASEPSPDAIKEAENADEESVSNGDEGNAREGSHSPQKPVGFN